MALLTRYTNRIVLAYDVDAAGEKAGGVGMAALVGLISELQRDTSGVKLEDVRVARLPDGKDPDDVVRESPADWETAIAKAKPLLEYLIDSHPALRPQDELRADRFRRGRDAGHPRDADPLRRDEALGQVRLRLGRGGARPAPGPGTAGTQPDQARATTTRESRITADAVLASPDALPINDILRAVSPVEAELLRLCSSVPDQQLRVVDELGPDQLPSTVARELFRAIVLQRAPNDQGIHPPFDGAALLAGPRR